MPIFFVCCSIIWIFGYKLKKYLHYMLLCLSLVLLLGGLMETEILHLFSDSHDEPVFYIGYTFGLLERILVLELPRIELKLMFGFISIIFRLCVFHPDDPTTIISQILMYLIAATVDIWKEKDDRALFKSFYDYREELTKFKNFMVSGLPTNILILSQDLSQCLFTNEQFEASFNIIKGTWNQIAWLKDFEIEKEINSALSIDPLAGEPWTLYRTLQKLRENVFSESEVNQCSLNVRYSIKTETGVKTELFEVKLFFFPWDGKDAVAIIMNNVTQRHMNVALQIADVNKDKIIATVSHELRTPLNGILGMISMLEKQVDDPQVLTYLGFCRNNGNLLLNIVNSILDLGQIRNNNIRLRPTKGNLLEVLKEIYTLFEFQFISKGIYLKVNTGTDLNANPMINTDINRLKQILINLVGNALKFTFTGGVEINVDIDGTQEGNIIFRVSDTGTGIKENNQKKLFKMYGRLEQADTATNSQGVGLGLTISNHLVKLLAGGEESEGIKMESEFGKGSIFSFSIKADLSDQDSFEGEIGETEGKEHNSSMMSNDGTKRSNFTLRATKSLCLSPGTPGRRLLSHDRMLNGSESSKYLSNNPRPLATTVFKGTNPISPSQISFHSDNEDEIECEETPERGPILIVDDNPFNLMVAQHLIQGLGFLVKTALSGQLAVDLVKEFTQEKKKFKLILMDLQMPVMDGYESTRVLIEMMAMGEVHSTPIVALSANDSDQDKMKCKEVGMSDHLGKPLNETQLRKVLNRFCRN